MISFPPLAFAFPSFWVPFSSLNSGQAVTMSPLAMLGATRYPAVKLPHPFLTVYKVQGAPSKLSLTLHEQPENSTPLQDALHSDDLTFEDPTYSAKESWPPIHDNTPWARARRSPVTRFMWNTTAPSLAQIWNVVHAIFLAYPTFEQFRVSLVGRDASTIATELLTTGLATVHPEPTPQSQAGRSNILPYDETELVILRGAFWQGAASPAGPRPIWAVGRGTSEPMRLPLTQYPPMPERYQLTNKFPQEAVYTRHPSRRPKPHVGSIVYSRYIPEVDQHFSLQVVDWSSDVDVRLFNKWQNDPRVAAGWNETGTVDHHREYLRKLHFDPHVLCLFGRFDDTRFSYYELYWSKVCISFSVLVKRRPSMCIC